MFKRIHKERTVKVTGSSSPMTDPHGSHCFRVTSCQMARAKTILGCDCGILTFTRSFMLKSVSMHCLESCIPKKKKITVIIIFIGGWAKCDTSIGKSAIVLTTVTHIAVISQSLRFYHHICSIFSTPFKGTDNILEAPTTHIIGTLAAQIYYMKFRYSIHEDSGTASKHRMGHSPRKYRAVL